MQAAELATREPRIEPAHGRVIEGSRREGSPSGGAGWGGGIAVASAASSGEGRKASVAATSLLSRSRQHEQMTDSNE